MIHKTDGSKIGMGQTSLITASRNLGMSGSYSIVINGKEILFKIPNKQKNLINDINWVNDEFLPIVQQRGKAVIDSRGASSATSAAKAALDTIVACENPTKSGDCFSAAVITDGSYDLPDGVICGMPLMTTSDGNVEIVRDIVLSDFAKEKIKISTNELIEERSAVEDLLK